jgi:hypothetical protein
MTQVIFEKGLIVGKLVPPYQGVGKCGIKDFGIIRIDTAQPIEIFPPVHIPDFCFIHVKGGDRYTAQGIVAVEDNILFNPTHRVGTPLYVNKPGPGLLRIVGIVFKTPVFGIVVIPSSGR